MAECSIALGSLLVQLTQSLEIVFACSSIDIDAFYNLDKYLLQGRPQHHCKEAFTYKKQYLSTTLIVLS